MKNIKQFLLGVSFVLYSLQGFGQEIIVGPTIKFLKIRVNANESNGDCSDHSLVSPDRSDALAQINFDACYRDPIHRSGSNCYQGDLIETFTNGNYTMSSLTKYIDLYNSSGNREEHRYYRFENFPAGRIRVHYKYHKEWPKALCPLVCACNVSDHERDITICKLGANGSIIAGTVYSSNGDRVVKPSGGNATISLYWESNIDYCTNTLSNMAVRKVGSGQTLTWRNIVFGNSGTRISFSDNYLVSESALGDNQYEIFLKDQNGSIFGPYLKTVKVVAPCANNSQLLVNTGGGTAPEIIDGGYSIGGYKFTKDVFHSLSLSLPAADGGLTTFSNLYDTYFDGIKVTNLDNETVNIGTTGFTYYYKLKKNVGSYNITAIPKDSAFTSSCPVFPPVRVFVSGSDLSAYSNCLIILPDDLPQLFPDLKTDWGRGYALTHFVYKVTSSKGIIITPGGTTGALLQNGAILKLGDPPITPPSPESPDVVRNWIKTKVYAENGDVIGETKEFYDNQGRPVQSQYKNLSDSVVMATQIIYDKYNRPAITTLPAPVLAETTNITTDNCGERVLSGQNMYFLYNGRFVTGTLGTPYRYVFFDSYSDSYGNVNRLNDPTPVENGNWGSLGMYYSNSNTASAYTNPALREDRFKEPFTPQTSYPYSRTIYDEDGSGLIKAVTLPGDYHKSGSGKYSVLDIVKVTSADTNIQRYFQMRVAAFPSLTNPSNLLNNAYIEKTTDSEGKVSMNYLDRDGNLLITLYVPTKDRSFNFYDETGALRYAVSPNGVKAFVGDAQNPPVSFSLIDKTTYIYNHKGQVIEQREPDAGVTKFMYRKDGSLRFSQNQLQQATFKFSYINYDSVGRVIETGEFIPCSGCSLQFNNAALKNILELKGALNDGLLGSYGYKSERIITFYDIPDVASPITQQFVHGAISYTERPGVSKTWYSYDALGRVIKTAQQISGWATKTVDYTYDPQGGISSVCYQKGQSDQFYHFYKYDADTRLKEVYTSKDSINTQLEAKYKYYLHGPLKRVELGTNAQNKALQGVDYVYTAQGWLKSINHWDKTKDPGVDINDAFGMTFDYFTGDYSKSGTNIGSMTTNVSGLTNYYNGIIRSNAWFSKKIEGSGQSELPTGYAYFYDNKYQLTSSVYGGITGGNFVSSGNAFKEDNISYDPNGNIRSLRRYNSSGAVLNNFTQYNYSANTNRLSGITGHSDSYMYDTIGQIIRITNSSVTKNIQYNSDGLMVSMFNGTKQAVRIYYDDRGNRLQKISYGANNNPVTFTYYINDINGNPLAIYRDDVSDSNPMELSEVPVYGAERLGTYFPSLNLTFYELKDHLGNVRATVSNYNGLRLETFSDYYPYGMASYFGNTYRYGFQGDYSEKDSETGWNAFDLRMYDPQIGRWLGPDPMRQFYSSYIGMGNNPVNGVDPNGGWAGPPDKKGSVVGQMAPGTDNDGLTYRWNGKDWGAGFVHQLPEITVGAPPIGIGAPGTYESLIPIWGAGRAAINHFQNENYWRGLGYSALAISDIFLVKAATTAIARGTITLAARYTVKQAVRNPSLTIREARAMANIPRVASMMRGKGVDRAFREFANRNIILRTSQKIGLISLSPMNRGADMVGKGLLKGYWWDVTTRGAWGSHVSKYGPGGIGLFYF
ncbi:MAG: RHS repeat-associated core domain-containing protein [Sporocytophaga sp.]|nr:RHS repeat-associated core domain-containing protein [Sporocytophaga sp.]